MRTEFKYRCRQTSLCVTVDVFQEHSSTLLRHGIYFSFLWLYFLAVCCCQYPSFLLQSDTLVQTCQTVSMFDTLFNCWNLRLVRFSSELKMVSNTETRRQIWTSIADSNKSVAIWLLIPLRCPNQLLLFMHYSEEFFWHLYPVKKRVFCHMSPKFR